MDVRDLSGKTALVTGAAAGIGRASALAFADRGADLVLCDIDDEGLAATAQHVEALGRSAQLHAVDVGDAAAMRALSEAVHASVGAVDILMNNAGVGMGASFIETSLEDWRWITDINYFGVIHGCHFFVPQMIAHGRGGHVINLASMVAYAPLVAASAYCATKGAVLAFSNALRGELAASNIGVTAVCPGFINTAIVSSSRVRGVAAEPSIRQKTIAFYRRRNYRPETVARKILAAVQKNRAVAPISAEAWATYLASRYAPGLLRTANRAMAHFGDL